MIEVKVERAANGALRKLSSAGHARAERSAACVALTTLLKSTARALATRPELGMSGTAPHPGVMQIELAAPKAAGAEYACGITELLLAGLQELAEEFPDEVRLSVGSEEAAAAGR